MPTAKAVHDASAPMAHARPNNGRPAAPLAEPANACQPMQATPATHSSSDSHRRRSGTAPCSRLPTTVTVTGTRPTTSEAIAIPPDCTALDNNR